MFFINTNLMKAYSLHKTERLCSTKPITELFENGNAFTINPFRVIWKEKNWSENSNAKIAISIPKKSFKKAVTRNLLKRRVREAYRLNKHILYNYLDNNNKQIIFIIIYLEKEVLDYHEIENKIIVILQRLIKDHKTSANA